jgi:hypothetical protein
MHATTATAHSPKTFTEGDDRPLVTASRKFPREFSLSRNAGDR